MTKQTPKPIFTFEDAKEIMSLITVFNEDCSCDELTVDKKGKTICLHCGEEWKR
jgi:hypothetical protein